MTDSDKEIEKLRVLLMCSVSQSCSSKDGLVSHDCMSVWESAFEYLENAGLMKYSHGWWHEFTVDPWDEYDRLGF